MIKKKYLKTKPICKCTFSLPVEAAPNAKEVALVGDFNNWQPDAHPLKRLKSGEFKTQLDLETGRDYQFRYLIDGKLWENDWQADAYTLVPEYGTDNSIVAL